jgi:hypothetical protein
MLATGQTYFSNKLKKPRQGSDNSIYSDAYIDQRSITDGEDLMHFKYRCASGPELRGHDLLLMIAGVLGCTRLSLLMTNAQKTMMPE